MLLRQIEVLTIVIKGAQVNVRCGMRRIEIKNLQVSRDRFRLHVGIFFERDAPCKPYRRFVFAGRRLWGWNRCTGDNFFSRQEVHDELPGNRLQQLAFVTKSDSVLVGKGSAGFGQRILHAGGSLLHGLQRFANHCWTHALGAQITNFFYLQEIEEGIGLRRSYEPCPLPVRQLALSEMENPQQICSTVHDHPATSREPCPLREKRLGILSLTSRRKRKMKVGGKLWRTWIIYMPRKRCKPFGGRARFLYD